MIKILTLTEKSKADKQEKFKDGVFKVLCVIKSLSLCIFVKPCEHILPFPKELGT